VRQFFKHRNKNVIEKVDRQAHPEAARRMSALERVDKGAQMLLALRYQELLRQGAPLPRLADVEFGCFSQNGEDGILLYLFSILGTASRKCVEICAGDCIECNSANLIVNHAWTGLLFDGSAANIARGNAFYHERRDGLSFYPPRMVETWITAENVNDLLRDNRFQGDVDLMVMDLDGMDYWIWKAIDCIQPRVVVVEYNQDLGAERAITIPYRSDYSHDWRFGYPVSASLPAFVKLGRQKGYRLVGCEHFGINAFFVRDDLGEGALPEVEAAACLPHANLAAGKTNRTFVEV
jgi:hypothetical protein